MVRAIKGPHGQQSYFQGLRNFSGVGFRLLDIFKPWPIGWVERRMRGAIAVVGDDVVAGAIAGGLLWGLHRALQVGMLA